MDVENSFQKPTFLTIQQEDAPVKPMTSFFLLYMSPTKIYHFSIKIISKLLKDHVSDKSWEYVMVYWRVNGMEMKSSDFLKDQWAMVTASEHPKVASLSGKMFSISKFFLMIKI